MKQVHGFMMAQRDCQILNMEVQSNKDIQSNKDMRLCFSPLTCRLSIGGITMTKLSGKKPQRPFSSPSHQPSSSVSFTWRLKGHIRSSNTASVLWDVKLLRGYQTVKQNMAALLSIYHRRYLRSFSGNTHDLETCHIWVIKTNVRHPALCHMVVILKVTQLVWLDEQYNTTTSQEKKLHPRDFMESIKSMTYSEETMPEHNNTMCSNLAQYHNNVSFLHLQLVLCFGLVVKHDLATLHHWAEKETTLVTWNLSILVHVRQD